MRKITIALSFMFFSTATLFGQIPGNAAALEVDSVPESIGLDIKAATNGLRIQQATSDGLHIQKTEGHAVRIDSSNNFGMFISHTIGEGIYLNHTEGSGYWVTKAGNPVSAEFPTESGNGLVIAGAESDGVFVGHSQDNGMHIVSTGAHGVQIDQTTGTGLRVIRAGGVSQIIPLNAPQTGIAVLGAEDHGVYVGRADKNGIYVSSAGEYGIRAKGDTAAAYFEGKVGVNTGSPESVLDLRQGNGNIAITMQTATSWPFKMTQKTNSVFSMENGGAERLTLLPDGKLGVGTSSPSAKLHVNGNIRWAPQTSYISVDAYAFQPKFGELESYDLASGDGLTIDNDLNYSFDNHMGASVSLPHNAIVVGVTVSFIKTSPASALPLTVQLFRRGLTNTTFATMASLTSSDSDPDLRTMTSASINQPTVDNANYSYYLVAKFTQFGNIDGLHRIRGVVIEYTTDRPY